MFDALGDATRRRVLELVRESGPAPVGSIAEAMPVSRPAVSQHLKVLEGAGLVTCTKRGTRHLYAVQPDGLAVSNHGHTFEWAGDVLDAAGKRVTETVSATANVSVSGTWLAVTTTCPAQGPSPLPGTMVFSATPTTLILAARDDQGTITSVTTYTRQTGVPPGFVHPPIPPSSK